MRVAIIGSRDCKNFHLDMIYKHLPEECTGIISGGAGGVDQYAEQAARERDLFFECIRPDYETYGRRAPLVRNKKIVEKADLVLAFWDFKSRGTAHVIVSCIENGTQVRVIGLDETARL